MRGPEPRFSSLVPSAVSSCAVRRKWQRPRRRAVHSNALAERFGQTVECDLVFVTDYIIFHLVDRCSGYSVACLLASRRPEDIRAAINTHWVAHYGVPEVLVTDGEGALKSEYASIWAEPIHTLLKVKAVSQHASTAERHNAFLRQALQWLLSHAKAKVSLASSVTPLP